MTRTGTNYHDISLETVEQHQTTVERFRALCYETPHSKIWSDVSTFSRVETMRESVVKIAPLLACFWYLIEPCNQRDV